MSDRRFYRMRKWYWDVLSPECEYFFVYFGSVEFCGRKFGSFTVHHAPSGGACTETRSWNVRWTECGEEQSGRRISFPGGDILVDGKGSSIKFAQGDSAISLVYTSMDAGAYAPVVMGDRGRRSILWRPNGLRCEVRGSLKLGDRILRLDRANGYGDYLESTILPPAVPVRRLVWGRLHHRDVDLVYVYATGNPGGKVWSRVMGTVRDEPFRADNLQLLAEGEAPVLRSDLSCPAVYRLTRGDASNTLSVSVRRIRPVQESSFIDHQDRSSPVVRAIARSLTRNPRSAKFLSEAEIVMTSGSTGTTIRAIPLIDEEAFL